MLTTVFTTSRHSPLSWTRLIHSTNFNLISVTPVLILYSTDAYLFQVASSLQFYSIKSVYISLFSHTCRMSYQSHSHWLFLPVDKRLNSVLITLAPPCGECCIWRPDRGTACNTQWVSLTAVLQLVVTVQRRCFLGVDLGQTAVLFWCVHLQSNL